MQQTSPFRWSNMQAITFACSVLFVILDLCQAQNDDNGSSLYTRRYEHLDIDTILASPRLVTNYVECLLNKKPCAPEGKALKRILPEALRTKCGRCWPSQKEGALKVITSLYYNYPDYYKALREKWDPTGEYNRRFEEYLRDQKFNSIGGNSDTEPGEQAQVNPQIVTTPQNETQSSSTTRSPSTLSNQSNQLNQPLTPLRLFTLNNGPNTNGPLLLRPLSRFLGNFPLFAQQRNG